MSTPRTALRTCLRTTPRPARAVLVGLVVLGATVVGGCSAAPEPAPTAPSASSSATPPVAPDGSASAVDPADVTFVREMVPHHQQAVQMSDLLLAKQGVRSDVTELATQIKDAQKPEILTMQGWLTAWGQPSSDSAGMDMGSSGMMDASAMDALAEADGPTAQRLYLQGMVEHHRGAVRMAQDEITDGQDPDAVALARDIVSSQQAEIATMERILATL